MIKHRITALSRKLRDYTDDPIPRIGSFTRALSGAKYPAYQINRIWHFNPEDLPAIAAVYELTPKVKPVVRQRRRESNSDQATA